MQAIADFLEIDIPAERWPVIIERCGFDYMKAHADKVAPLGGAIFDGGAESFIHKGVNGRWREVRSAADTAAYEAIALDRLGPDCARWLATGKRDQWPDRSAVEVLER